MMDEATEYRLNDILDSLEDLGISPPAQDAAGLNAVLEGGFSDREFRILSSSLSNSISKLPSSLSSSSSLFVIHEDPSEFTRTMQDFLKHYGYPYPGDPRADTLRVIEFLVAELQTSRLLFSQDVMDVDSDIPEQFLGVFKNLQQTCESLGISFAKESPNQATQSCTDKINQLLPQLPNNYVTKPIVSKDSLSPQDFETIQQINEALEEEYKQRFVVLRKRLEVTLQGFLWSDKGQEKEAEIKKIIKQKLASFPTAPTVTLHELFSVQTEIAKISKTSNNSTKSPTDLKALLIGDVPDRGGRPKERKDANMPSFKARETDHPQEQRSARRGRVHGGWRGHGKEKGGSQEQEPAPQKQTTQTQQQEGHNQNAGRGGHQGGGGGGGRGGRGGWSGNRGGGRGRR